MKQKQMAQIFFETQTDWRKRSLAKKKKKYIWGLAKLKTFEKQYETLEEHWGTHNTHIKCNVIEAQNEMEL